MLFVVPDYYDSFHCLAEKCRHSCCVGWEIDIDEDTLEVYKTMPEICSHISAEPEPHFILDAAERCPFLEKSGLCRLILEHGEDFLCDICAEHPRFYNEFSDRTEYGVGMCCEAATELLLNGEAPQRLVYDGEPESEPEVFILRELIFTILCDSKVGLAERLKRAGALVGAELAPVNVAEWAQFLLGLERLDDAWTEKLLSLTSYNEAFPPKELDALRYERIAEYFIFRYFASAEEAKRGAVIALAQLAAVMVCALDSVNGQSGEHLRLFSSEIEYSDVNISLIP